MKKFFVAFAAFVLCAAASAQQSQQTPPKTLTEANLVIAQQQAQIAELNLRVAELEAAFTSQLSDARKQEEQQIQAAQAAVQQEHANAAAKDKNAKH